MSVAALPSSPTPLPAPLPDSPWSGWRAHFEANRRRPLPVIDHPPGLSTAATAALASSLARFQIGETGEGRIVAAVARSEMAGIDDHYRRALALFIAEEGRHAHILAGLVRALGGRLLTSAWSERVFVWVRRLAGIRLKLFVMLAAEVVGCGFYGGLAAALPWGAARSALEQIAEDERAHLAFHRHFFALQAPAGWRRVLFLCGWFLLAHATALVVLWDHRRTLRALSIPRRAMAGRLRALVRAGAR